MPDRREELIREGFATWERGDAAATLALYHPDVVVYAPPEIGNPGTFHGIEGFLEWAQAWYDAWDSFEQELVAVEPVGERHAIADVRQTATGRGSGIEVKREATWIYEIRDDKLVYMSVAWDRDRALEHAREREAERAD